MNKKPPLPLTAFMGVSQANVGGATSGRGSSAVGVGAVGGAAPMCFSTPSKNEKQRDHHGGGLCGCQKAPKSHCISATGVLILVLLYTAMGSIIFVTLEGEIEDTSSLETAVAASKPYPRTEFANAEIRSRTVDRLWSITEDLNILYKENWTRLAAQEVQHFQDTLLRAVRQSKIDQYGGVPVNRPTHKWNYASAFLYSLTLVTTIGYGGISPRTQWGRIAALIYAIFGIPIILLYLSAMGEALSAGMRCIFRKMRSKSALRSGSGSSVDSNSSSSGGGGGGVGGIGGIDSTTKLPPGGDIGKANIMGGGNKPYSHPHHNNKMHSASSTHHYTVHPTKSNQNVNRPSSPSIPISICVMVLICYITSGAVLFHKMQNWTVLESLYFCFTALGTIGFGELAPTGNLALYLASGYILVGMAVVAMCFSLIQTEIVMWLRKFSVKDHVMPQPEEVALVSVAVTPKSS